MNTASYPGRLWAQLAKCVYFVTCGFCGTPSSPVDEPQLTEPLLRNAQQRPAASCEAPAPVLASTQGQPPAAVSSAPPAVSAAASGRAQDSRSARKEASGAHASPTTSELTSSEAESSGTPSKLTQPVGQNGSKKPYVSHVAPGTDQVRPSPTPHSPQPTQAPVSKGQAPSADSPDLPATSESSPSEHAPLRDADQASSAEPSPQAAQSSAAELPAAAPLVEDSKPSADPAVAATAAAKQPSASSAAAAAPSASGSHRPHSHHEASQGDVPESAGQERDDNAPAVAPGTLSNESAGVRTLSEAQVKPSAKEAAATDKKSAANARQAGPSVKGAAAANEGLASKLRQVEPSVKETAAGHAGPTATAVGAKQSTCDPSSTTEENQAVSTPSQTAVQSTSRSVDRKPSTADEVDMALGAGESQSAEATASLGTEGDTTQHKLSGPSRQGLPASERKSPEPEVISQPQQPSVADDGDAEAADAKKGKSQEQEISQSQQPSAADQDDAGHAKKPQPKAGAVNGPTEEHSVRSATGAAPRKTSPKEAKSGGRAGAGDTSDSSTAELPIQARPDTVEDPLQRDVPANTASSSTQQSKGQVTPPMEAQEEPSDSSSVTGSLQPASPQHVSGKSDDDSGSAANGHSKDVGNSPSSGESSGAGTAVEELGSRGNSNDVAVAKGGSHNASPGQEGSDKGQPAASRQGSPAGNGPGAVGTAKSGSDLPGSAAVSKDAEKGHADAAQAAETGTAQSGTAKIEAAAGKKKNKGKKKKKSK